LLNERTVIDHPDGEFITAIHFPGLRQIKL
jgi:hypothetical protein